MNYWELRKEVSKLIPRKTYLIDKEFEKIQFVKEKGRKTNYYEFDILSRNYKKRERLLNTGEIKNFLEISLRAAYCPMPFNGDLYDGLNCPYRCRYCYADSFRASLYTSFFDNGRTMGIRSCNPSYFKSELDKLFKLRFKETKKEGVQKAVSNNVPIRLGIRYENFIKKDLEKKIALEFLIYLKENSYPVMINTKSNIVGYDKYVMALSENEAKAAVHITMISSDNKLLKSLEPGAPSFEKRIQAAKNLTSSGVRVVARIEPFMIFVNDGKDETDLYIQRIKESGVQHVTFDTYSYSANNSGVRNGIELQGIDFDRMYQIMSECQWLGSLLLGKYMDYFRENGLKCSTFDFGNVPKNDDHICCCLDGFHKNGGFNPGNVLSAIRFIIDNGKATWGDFEKWVENNGGWLSKQIKSTVFESWNLLNSNPAYYPTWAQGVKPIGYDNKGLVVYEYNKNEDHRIEILRGLI